MSRQEQFLMCVQTYCLTRLLREPKCQPWLPVKVMATAAQMLVDHTTPVYNLALDFVDVYWRELSDPDRLPILIDPPRFK